MALAEVKRVLVDNGRFYVAALSKENDGIATWLYEFFHDQFPAYADCRPIFVRQLLVEQGFHGVDGQQEFMFGLPVEIILTTV